MMGAGCQELYLAAGGVLDLAKTAGGDQVLRGGSRPDPAPTVRTADVVLVDNDETVAGLLLHALEARGYTAHWLQDGLRAAEELRGPYPNLTAGVVLLNADLPGLGGLDALKLLVRHGVLERTRVIMVTDRQGEAEAVAALELGAFDQVAKPFSVPLLMQRIRRALQT